MSGEFFFPVELTPDLSMAVARISSSPRVILQFALSDGSVLAFDQYRQPVVWLDSEAAVDMGQSAALQDLYDKLGDMDVHYTFDEKSVTGVIWHGKRAEGLGVIENLLNAASLTARVYYNDYSSSDYEMTSGDLQVLKSRLSEALRL